MVKICLNVFIFKDALIPKLCYIRWRIFTSEDSVKWYEWCNYVSLLDLNFRHTASNDWHNKLHHYDRTFSQFFPIVLVYSLKWYLFLRNVIHAAIKFLSVYDKYLCHRQSRRSILIKLHYTVVSPITIKIKCS